MGGPLKTDKGPLFNEWAWMGVALLVIAMASTAMVGVFFTLASVWS